MKARDSGLSHSARWLCVKFSLDVLQKSHPITMHRHAVLAQLSDGFDRCAASVLWSTFLEDLYFPVCLLIPHGTVRISVDRLRFTVPCSIAAEPGT